MDLLGKSLDELRQANGGKFSLKTTLLLFDQLLRRFEDIHSKGYIHRDVKPENLLIGLHGNAKHVVHVIDFGIAKLFVDKTSGQHIPACDRLPMFGTARFASIGALSGRGKYIKVNHWNDLPRQIVVFLTQNNLERTTWNHWAIQ